MYYREESPLIIGGKGGSGTRVVSQIIQRLGYYLGPKFNASSDSMEMVPFLKEWYIKCLEYWWEEKLDTLNYKEIENDLQLSLKHHFPHGKKYLWGFKNPQSINMLPVFYRLYPNMKFIHVIRDGRDIAFSKNQQELTQTQFNTWNRKNYPAFTTLWEKSIAYWNKLNLTANNFGCDYLLKNYLLVKFEDLISNPIEEISRIDKFLGTNVREDEIKSISNLVSVPSSFGRYRQHGDLTIQRLEIIAKEGLLRFNYL